MEGNQLERINTAKLLENLDDALERTDATHNGSDDERHNSSWNSTLSITLKNCKDLKLPSTLVPGDKLDPFVVIRYEEQEFTSQDVIEGHDNPEWTNACFNFNINNDSVSPELKLSDVVLKVFLRDIMSESAEFVGQARVCLMQLIGMNPRTSRNSYEANHSASLEGGGGGEITVAIRLELARDTTVADRKVQSRMSAKMRSVNSLSSVAEQPCTRVTIDEPDIDQCEKHSQQQDVNSSENVGSFQVSWTNSEAFEREMEEKERRRKEIEAKEKEAERYLEQKRRREEQLKQRKALEAQRAMEKLRIEQEKERSRRVKAKRQQALHEKMRRAAVRIQKTFRGFQSRLRVRAIRERVRQENLRKERRNEVRRRIEHRAKAKNDDALRRIKGVSEEMKRGKARNLKKNTSRQESVQKRDMCKNPQAVEEKDEYLEILRKLEENTKAELAAKLERIEASTNAKLQDLRARKQLKALRSVEKKKPVVKKQLPKDLQRAFQVVYGE